jgi:hypothetical protein
MIVARHISLSDFSRSFASNAHHHLLRPSHMNGFDGPNSPLAHIFAAIGNYELKLAGMRQAQQPVPSACICCFVVFGGFLFLLIELVIALSNRMTFFVELSVLPVGSRAHVAVMRARHFGPSIASFYHSENSIGRLVCLRHCSRERP